MVSDVEGVEEDEDGGIIAFEQGTDGGYACWWWCYFKRQLWFFKPLEIPYELYFNYDFITRYIQYICLLFNSWREGIWTLNIFVENIRMC